MQDNAPSHTCIPAKKGPPEAPCILAETQLQMNDYYCLTFSLYTEDSTLWLSFWALFFPFSPFSSPPHSLFPFPSLPFFLHSLLFLTPFSSVKNISGAHSILIYKELFQILIVILKSIVQIHPYPLFMSTYVVLRIFQSLATANNAEITTLQLHLTMNLSLLVERKDRHS